MRTPEELWAQYESFVREDVESSVLIDFGARPLPGSRAALARLVAEERADERMECVKCVPRNWTDPLLTGDKATIKTFDCREIEALLTGVQDRIACRSPRGGS